MVKNLVLTQQDGRKFTLSGPTQIGRIPPELKNYWAVPEREKPEIFDNLEAFIRTRPEDTAVSRNHSGIFKQDADYFIVDLNSKYGTFVNAENINPDRSDPQPRKLHSGDRILMSHEEFTVSLDDLKDYALLVGAGEDHPGAMENDISALERQLRRRGYIVQNLMRGELTKRSLKEKLDEIKYLTTPGSHFLLSFNAHGSRHGISIGQQILNPEELYKKMRQMRGKNAIIIESCNAGLFVNERNRPKIPEGTLVLTACGQDEVAQETRVNRTGEPVQYMARLHRALVDYLRHHPEKFDLRDFYNNLRTSGHANLILQGPAMAGDGYTVGRQVTRLVTRSSREEHVPREGVVDRFRDMLRNWIG